MKADLGMNSYNFRIGGVVLSTLSLAGYLLFSLSDFNPVISGNLTSAKLSSWLFACGLLIFLYSKDRKQNEAITSETNTISRLFLTALYACLIAFSLIQHLNNDFTINILVVVLFFLIVQLIYTLSRQYGNVSNKGFYIASTIIFLAGLIVLILI